MKVFNSAEKTVIDIIGKEIGESWFSEGFTANDLNEQIKGAKEIEINLSSLGGDVNEAFQMHDFLKMHPATVTVNMIGANASSATVIAMGADKVLMSKNGLFLIHNVWTLTAGNADDLEEQAGELRKWDNVLVKIYKEKLNGKKESQIRTLMSEEKWLSYDDAMDWGFIDGEVCMGAKCSLKNLKSLGKLNMKETKLNEILNLEEIEETKDGVYFNKEQLDEMNTKIADFEKQIEEKQNAMEAIEADLQKKESDFAEEKATIEANYDAKIKDFEKKESDLTEKIAALEADLAKANQNPIEPDNEIDPPIDKGEKDESVKKFYNEIFRN